MEEKGEEPAGRPPRAQQPPLQILSAGLYKKRGRGEGEGGNREGDGEGYDEGKVGGGILEKEGKKWERGVR